MAATSTDPSQTPSDDDSEVCTKAMIARCVNVKKKLHRTKSVGAWEEATVAKL